MASCSRGKVCITMQKISQLKSTVYIVQTEDFDLAEALESVYPLLEIVFSYLDYKDLERAALVKRSWQITADKVLHKRNQLSWITVFKNKKQSYVHYSKHYPYTNVALGLILFNYKEVSLNDYFCCHDKFSQRKIKFSDFLADQVVPSGIKYGTVGCLGLVSMFSKTLTTKSSMPLFDCCFIPLIPNVRTSMFRCNPLRMRDDHVKPNEKLKCVLFFCKQSRTQPFYKILERLVPEHDCQNVAIGGGIIKGVLCHPEEFRRHPDSEYTPKGTSLCIVFTEDIYCESVFSASSIVISGDPITSEQFEAELLQFKRRIVLRSRSFAFSICCVEKIRKNPEARIFNKLFPNTPLMGMEADGEIGWNCYNNSPGISSDNEDGGENLTKKVKKGYPDSQHFWSTVIVFLTWGQLVHCQD